MKDVLFKKHIILVHEKHEKHEKNGENELFDQIFKIIFLSFCSFVFFVDKVLLSCDCPGPVMLVIDNEDIGAYHVVVNHN